MTVDPELHGGTTVVRIGSEGGREWDAYVHSNVQSTTYHRYAWRSIFGETFGYRSFYLVARKDGAICGCVPLFLVGPPFARRLVAVPFRDRGGILWTTADAYYALVQEARTLAAETGAKFVELKSVIDDYPPVEGMQRHMYWVRSVVDLSSLNSDQLWKKIGAKTRNMIRQAEQAELQFDDLTDSPDAVELWHQLHLTTQRRQGLPPFPQAFFRRMVSMLRSENGVRLFAVRNRKDVISATIILLHGSTAVYGYSASSAAAQRSRPNDFMLFNVMKWVVDEGYGQFDLGSDAPAQDSLLFFKRKWLAVQAPVPVYVLGKADLSLSDSSHPRYRIGRQILRHCPLPVLRMIGNVATGILG